MCGVHLLIVLADTDAVDPSLSALDLHAGLAATGTEVRTVALGPGRRGGLDQLVPTLAPSPHSLASVLQLRRESAWADVVLAFGLTAARSGRRARVGGRRLAVVVTEHVGNDREMPRPDRRTLDAAAVVVALDDGVATALREVSPLHSELHRLDVPMTPVSLEGVEARAGAARRALDLDPHAPVLWWTGPGAQPPPDGLLMEAERRRWPLLAPGDGDDELMVAASDTAVLTEPTAWGAPRELLRAAATGHALVAPSTLCDGRLVDDRTGVGLPDGGEVDWPTVLDGLSGPATRAAMASRAHERVSRHFAPDAVLPRWAEVLAGRVPGVAPD